MNINIIYDRGNDELYGIVSLVKRHSGTYGISECGDVAVTISIDTSLSPESYRIVKDSPEVFRISGGDRLGLIYGIGRLLHRGPALVKTEKCVPEKKIRGIYFATHFYNYYQSAPIEKVTDYLEELVFWGCNSIAMWFDMHHFSGLNTPEAEALMNRIHSLAAAAKKIGLKVLLGTLANEYYYGAPTELLAENETDGTGYFAPLCGFYNTELCPGKPQAKELLITSHREVLRRFSDVGLDYVWLWPYDQGGCTCKDCRPWGGRGFVKLSCELAKVVKELFPDARCAVSTWRFDAFTNGEWELFTDRLDEISDDFQYAIMNFSAGNIPDRFYKESDKRGLSLFGFPEISMLCATPWGGFGGVPVPTKLYNDYIGTKDLHSGGFAYSEGIFEDINKVIMLGLYQGSTVQETVEDYFRFYFSEASTEYAWEFVGCLESTLPRKRIGADGIPNDYPRDDYVAELPTFKLLSPEKVSYALELVEKIRSAIPKELSESDRFRMLYLRAVIDKALLKNDGRINGKTEKAASELQRMFYAENADYAVSPITESAIRENRGHI